MSNATAGGPSQGILDILFGSKNPEEAEPDGQGFGGLMNLIKALKEKKDSEALKAGLSRTQGETMPGKGGTEGSPVGMPGVQAAQDAQGSPFAQMPVDEDLKERNEKLLRLSMLFGTPAAAAMMQAPVAQPEAPLPTLQPEQVNHALKQKALPPLKPQEMKLLQDINGKIELANAGQSADPPPLLAAGAGAVAQDQSMNANLQKAIAEKGIDPRKLKGTELTSPGGLAGSASGTPEKILSTETYLQIHEGMKAPVKDAAVKHQPAMNEGLPAPQARSTETLTANAVAGTSQKGLPLSTRKGEGEELLPEGTKQAKLDAAAGGGFASALAPTAGEVMRHDVYLPGAEKPEEMRRALLGEVGTGVALHAGKGGGEMRLVLHPDDMGEVKLKVGTKNGQVEVELMAGNEDTAKLLRSGSKELELSLKEQNLSLAKFEVTVSDASYVVATDTKSSLNEQFLSQQDQQQPSGGFSKGANGEDGRNSRWGNDQGGRQGSSYGSAAEDSGRDAAKAANFATKQAARDSSRRLDVVA